jgi:hypothetical protein
LIAFEETMHNRFEVETIFAFYRRKGEQMKYVLFLLMLSGISGAAEISCPEGERSLASTPDQPPVCVPAPRPARKRRRVVKKAPPQAPKEVVVTKEVEKVVEKEVIKTIEIEPYRNRVKLLGGAGPYYTGILERTTSAVSLSSHYAPMVGVGYERLLSKRWSVEGQIFTNASWAVGVGFGF